MDEAGTLFYYSTRGDTQVVHIRHGERLSGALDEEAMIAFCQTKGIRLLVDAAHPFAERLRETIAVVARRLTLPVVRWERRYPPRSSDIHWCASYEKAMEELESADVHRLLALTGVQTIVRLKSYWRRNTCFFRVLNRPESIEFARRQGFPLVVASIKKLRRPVDWVSRFMPWFVPLCPRILSRSKALMVCVERWNDLSRAFSLCVRD